MMDSLLQKWRPFQGPPPAEIDEEEEPQSDDENEPERSYTVDAGGPRLRARKRQAPFSAKANISK